MLARIHRRWPSVLSGFALASLLTTPALAQAPPAAGAASGATRVTSVEGITEYRLQNGMRVLLFPDTSKPTVTINITYLVGSRHEGYGETGMAHLLEHMLFKGTKARPDIWKLLQDRGAKFNGTTWFDRTNYYEELPASAENLTFALELEADRMVNSTIAPDALAKEFSVVRNEFEMGENDPGTVLEEKIFATAYQWHNYGKSTIGSRSDIERVPVENLRGFYRRHYQPDNALLVVAGKFDEPKALEQIVKIFGVLPRPTRTLIPTWTEEPVQDGERHVVLRRAGDLSVVAVAYHGVAGAHPDWLASDALTDVMTNKPAGRLYKALVEKGLASEVFGYLYPTAEPGLMYFGAKVRTGGSPEKLLAALIKAVEGLARQPVTEVELDRWRTKSRREFELALTDTAQIGVALSDWAAMGDWRLFFLTRDRLAAIKAADATRVAASFLKASNRTSGVFLPSKNPDRSPAAGRADVAALMKDWKGGAAVSAGEVFAATIENVEKRTTRKELPGGLSLALLPKKTKGGVVRMRLALRFGNEKELTGKSTAADLLPQMLMRGTKKHSYQQLKDAFDKLKAEVSFGTGSMMRPSPGVAVVNVKTVRENLSAVLSLVTEVLREPAFPKAEFETLRKETLAGLEEQLQDPMANGFSVLFQKLFPAPRTDVRYITTPKEEIEQVKRLQLADLVRLHKSQWGVSAAQLAIVGDFDDQATSGQIEKELASWASAKPYERIALPYAEGVADTAEIDTPDKQMAMVSVGHPIKVRDDHPDYPALVLIDHMLGGSANSRLLNRLRQKEGLSYSAFSTIHAESLDESGALFAGAICAPANADKAMATMLEEIDLFLKKGIPAQELSDAKKSYAATWDNNLAEDGFVLSALTSGLHLKRTFAYWKTINDRIQTLTAAEIEATARKYLQPGRFTRIKAGDLKKKS